MSSRAKRVAGRLKVFGFAAVVVLAIVAALVVDPPDRDDSVVVSEPDAQMSAETVEQLAQASAAQGVCYGWRLSNGGTTVSQGSSLGPGIAVDDDLVRCPRWVEVRVSVWYTSASSEAADSASAIISAFGVTPPLKSGLDRFGLTKDAFIDEPARAICQAALVLPLLVAEDGSAPAVPGDTSPTSGSAVPAAAVTPLPAAGSDFWRDRWGYVLGTIFLFLIAVLVVAIGWLERRHHQRSAAPVRPTAGSQPAPWGARTTDTTTKP